jgi:ribosome-associated translation inhibitor RaiA
MTIEFHTAAAIVPEKLVAFTRDELLRLSHLNKNISRAEVLMKEDETIIRSENKICEIRLTLYGDDLFSHTRSGSFEESAKEAIKELNKMVKHQVKEQKEPPDKMISTVKL